MIGMKRNTSAHIDKKGRKDKKEVKEVYDLVEPADEPTPKRRRRHVPEESQEDVSEKKELEPVRPKVKRQRKRTVKQDTKSANFFGIDAEEEEVTPVEKAISKAKFSFGMDDDDDDSNESIVETSEETLTKDELAIEDEEDGVLAKPADESANVEEIAEESMNVSESTKVSTSASWGSEDVPEMISDDVSIDVKPGEEKPLEPLKMQGKLDGLPVIEKLQRVIALYNSRNGGACADDITIKYSDDSLLQVDMTANGTLTLPNYRVFSDGRMVEWDNINELRIPKGATVELDLGVSILLPDFYELELISVHDLRTKYGLMMQQPVKVSRQNAMFPLTVILTAVEDLAYIQKFRSIIQARIVRV